MELSFKAGSVIESDIAIPKNTMFVCLKCHKSGWLKNIQKEYVFQPESLKGEIDLTLNIIGSYKDYENLWRPYLIGDIIGLAYVIAKNSNVISKISGISKKNNLT